MRKIKELLLFMAPLIVLPIIPLMVSRFTADVISDRLSFVGVDNYIRMFLNDKTFGKVLFNTFFGPAIFSFLIIAVFAVIVYLVRKKIKVPRGVFYLGSVFIGGITALIYLICVNVAVSGVSSDLYAAQTIVSHIVDYKLSVFDVISFPNELFSLYIGVFASFIFWLLELIVNTAKNIRRKRALQ